MLRSGTLIANGVKQYRLSMLNEEFIYNAVDVHAIHFYYYYVRARLTYSQAIKG